jgi:SAM-dependent methyltransferase
VPLALLRKVLEHPLTASLDLDDPATTSLRKRIIVSKPFLKAIYNEWYTMLAAHLPDGTAPVLEIGSGAGYCSQFVPGLITSEMFLCSDVMLVADAQKLPFATGSLRAIIMTNVLHHMPNVADFFADASRCLLPGGKILMIEPWVSPWSTIVYKYFHHEVFQPKAEDWSFVSSGPVSSANIAMPWMVLARDREIFKQRFPELQIEEIRPFMPFRYIVSGGIGHRSLMPGFMHDAWRRLESALDSQAHNLGMFAFISVRRQLR